MWLLWMRTLKFSIGIEEFGLHIRRCTTPQKGIERLLVRMHVWRNPKCSTAVAANMGTAELRAFFTVNAHIFRAKFQILGCIWVEVSANRIVDKAKHQ